MGCAEGGDGQGGFESLEALVVLPLVSFPSSVLLLFSHLTTRSLLLPLAMHPENL